MLPLGSEIYGYDLKLQRPNKDHPSYDLRFG
jgi:hypothetical protein